LTGLRDAINNAGIGLTVSIINSGAESGAYYLSVTAQQPGATALALRTEAGNNATNLLTTSNQGANADFYLNGIRIICSDNTINDIVDGLTLNIVSKTEPEEEVTISASSSRGSLATGINNFVSAYNAAASVVNGHIGENAGVLSGDPILRQIQSVLRQATGYTGSGAVSSLAGLGIELDKKGTMSFNSAKFYALSTSGFEAGMDLMGSTTTGFGALSRKLDEISNPITGLIKKQQDTIDAADSRIDDRVASLLERIEVMQLSLSSKLQQADLLISQFSAQQQQLDSVIKSLSTMSFGKEKGQ
jgi:flagellar hook-associated protein 2